AQFRFVKRWVLQQRKEHVPRMVIEQSGELLTVAGARPFDLFLKLRHVRFSRYPRLPPIATPSARLLPLQSLPAHQIQRAVPLRADADSLAHQNNANAAPYLRSSPARTCGRAGPACRPSRSPAMPIPRQPFVDIPARLSRLHRPTFQPPGKSLEILRRARHGREFEIP